MAHKIYLNIDTISKIIITYKSNVECSYIPEVLPRPVKLFGLTLWIKKGKEAMWDCLDTYYPRTNTKMKSFEEYIVDDDNKVVYYKPSVLIVYSKETFYRKYFKTNAELDEYVSSITNKTNSKFIIEVKTTE